MHNVYVFWRTSNVLISWSDSIGMNDVVYSTSSESVVFLLCKIEISVLTVTFIAYGGVHVINDFDRSSVQNNYNTVRVSAQVCRSNNPI